MKHRVGDVTRDKGPEVFHYKHHQDNPISPEYLPDYNTRKLVTSYNRITQGKAVVEEEFISSISVGIYNKNYDSLQICNGVLIHEVNFECVKLFS